MSNEPSSDEPFRVEPERFEHDVFVSYSALQEGAARSVATALEETGLIAFFAPLEMRKYLVEEETGTYVNPLQSALVRSCHCVALLSGSYLDSSWCLLEMWGFFNLLSEDGRRTLRILCLEDVRERIPARLRGFIFEGSDRQLIDDLCKASQDFSRGGELGKRRFAGCFAPLTKLREFYEPPGMGKRPPWGKDARSPHGCPGYPRFDFYADFVREYMVQIMRGMDPAGLPVNISELAEHYRKDITRAARRDAQRLLDLGFSPFQIVGRPTLQALWDSSQSDSPYAQYCRGLVLLYRGQYKEAVEELEKALNPKLPQGAPEHKRPKPHQCVTELAQAYWGAGEPAKALEAIEKYDREQWARTRRVRCACLAELGRSDEARLEIEQAMEQEPDFSLHKERLNSYYDDTAEMGAELERWLAALARAGLK